MVIKYLYLDDDELESVKPYSSAVVSDIKGVTIDIKHPGKYKNDFVSLIRDIKDYQGLILDWRLDETADQEKRKYNFRAASLAQEIRSRVTEKKLTPIPIVLWSQQNKLKKTYQGDFTAHDLFDLVFKKEYISDNPLVVGNQLLSLALGYQTINEFINQHRNIVINDILCIERAYLDIRIQEYFRTKTHAVHEIAHFILRDLLERPGLLIEENRLAARLGIDIEKSSGWKKILAILEKYKYVGPFNQAWQRWWAYGIENEWWMLISEQKQPLSLLSAEDRVKILKTKTKLRSIVAATKIKENYHSRFYTICEYSKKPLDPIDGVIIAEEEPKPWQERKYISLNVALERREGFEPHPTELERLRQIRKVGG